MLSSAGVVTMYTTQAVKLNVEGKDFYIDIEILKIFSEPLFNKVIKTGKQEDFQQEVSLEDINPASFERILT